MIVEPRIEAYVDALWASPDPVLAAMEALAERRRFPIVGRHAGALLGMLARCLGAQRVLEMGSGYGYSALWFARAMPETGKVTCSDLSADNRDLAMGYFRTAGLESRVEFLVGNSLAVAQQQAPGFDIVFNDIDKEDYPRSVDVAVRLLRSGGLFISDNTLWSGKVAESGTGDAPTEAIRTFNKQVFARADLESVIVPIRDGLTVCRKK
ncbi:MAG TPA: O-methyltransferase [Spirochaetia bacterium]|nr:O-methyltransferase [Spirochaetia bacterium]